MKAVVVSKYGGTEVLQVEEIPVPEPGFKQVLIRVHAAGVNPVDTYIRAGMFAHSPMFNKMPFTPGMDGAGVVEAVGPGVTRFKKGDRVFSYSINQGNYAQYVVCPENYVWTLPASVSFQQGAGVGIPYFTAYRALFQTGKPKSAKTVLIHGASGGVGLAAVQIAREAGMLVLGTAGTDAGLKLVKDAGADHVFNHKENGYLEKIKKVTNGEGIDIILEMIANINLPADMEIIKKSGIIAVIGSRGSVEINPGHLLGNEGRIIGVAVLMMSNEELAEAGQYIVRGLANGTLVPIIDKEYPLEKAGAAHKDIIESSGAKGKLVLVIK